MNPDAVSSIGNPSNVEEEEDLLRQSNSSNKKRPNNHVAEGTKEPLLKRFKDAQLTEQEQHFQRAFDKLTYDPKEYTCPISRRLFINPVFCSDGFTYEKESIKEWLSKNAISPQNGLRLISKELHSSQSTKQNVIHFKDKNVNKIVKFCSEHLNTSDAKSERQLVQIRDLLVRAKEFNPIKDQIYELLVNVTEQLGDQKQLIEVLRSQGIMLNRKDKKNEASVCFDRLESLLTADEAKKVFWWEVLAMYKEWNNDDAMNKTSLKIALQLIKEEKFAVVSELLQKRIDKLDRCLLEHLLHCQEKLGETDGTARTLFLIGGEFHKEKEFTSAIDYYQRSLVVLKQVRVLECLKDAYIDNNESKKAAEVCMQLADLCRRDDRHYAIKMMHYAVNLDKENDELFDKVQNYFRDEQLLTDLVSLLFTRMNKNDPTMSMMQTMFHAISKKIDENYCDRICVLEDEVDHQGQQLYHLKMFSAWVNAVEKYLQHIPREFSQVKALKSETIKTRNSIKSLIFLEDKKVIAGHLQNGIEIWDVQKKQRQAHFGQQENMVDVWAMTLVGDYLVCASDERTGLCVFSKDGVLRTTYPTDSKICTGRKSMIGFGGSFVLFGSADKTIRLYDISVNEGHSPSLMTLKGHDRLVTCLEYGPGGRLISGSHDKTIRVWNMHNERCEMVLKGSENSIFCLALIDNKTLASSDGNQIRLWDLSTGSLLGLLVGHTKDINQIVALGDLIASCSDDHRIIFWDVKKFEAVHTLEHDTYIFNLIALPTGELVSSDEAGLIKIWNIPPL
jgi:tetratricopeptide (TPR) repeat protein